MEFKKVVKTTLKVAGALTVATGVVAAGAIVASGAAAGSMVEGFKAAGKTFKKLLGEKEETETAQAEETKEEESVVAEPTVKVEAESAQVES